MGASQKLAALRKNIELARWDYLTESRPRLSAALDVTQLTLREYELRNLQANFGAVFGYNIPANDAPNTFADAEKRLMYYHLKHKPPSRAAVIRGLLDNVRTVEAWDKARAANDFNVVAPDLGRAMGHEIRNNQYAFRHSFWEDLDAMPANSFDVALDRKAEGFRSRHMVEWGQTLIPFCREMLEKEQKRQATQRYLYPDAFKISRHAQKKMLHDLLGRMGYDETRGRIAEAPHPMCLGRNDDVRIGYAIDSENILNTLLATVHEGGHAFYRQNLPDAQKDMLSGDIAGNVVDEAMALLFENIVFRSKAGASFFYDMIARELGEPYRSRLSPQMIFKQMTKLEPHGIRAKADDIRYPLDILHRHEILFDMYFKGVDIDATAYAAYWDEYYEQLTGIKPQDDIHGILQDIHLFAGEGAWLMTYLPGRLAASQIAEAFFAENPKQRKIFNEYGGLDRELKALEPMKIWLKEKICAEGARLKPFELIKHVTGKPLSPDAYMAHVKDKYAPPRYPVVATQNGFAL